MGDTRSLDYSSYSHLSFTPKPLTDQLDGAFPVRGSQPIGAVVLGLRALVALLQLPLTAAQLSRHATCFDRRDVHTTCMCVK